jgi:DNA-binding transcriptional ArsR family regulator
MSPALRPSTLIDRATARTYAAWFKALSDPTRVQILNLLAAARRPLSVGEIVEHADVRQPTVSHHLKLLADVRLVVRERDGANVRYSVDRARLDALPSAADAVLGRPTPSG